MIKVSLVVFGGHTIGLIVKVRATLLQVPSLVTTEIFPAVVSILAVIEILPCPAVIEDPVGTVQV